MAKNLKVGDRVRTKSWQKISDKLSKNTSPGWMGTMTMFVDQQGTVQEIHERGFVRIGFDSGECTWWWSPKWVTKVGKQYKVGDWVVIQSTRPTPSKKHPALFQEPMVAGLGRVAQVTEVEGDCVRLQASFTGNVFEDSINEYWWQTDWVTPYEIGIGDRVRIKTGQLTQTRMTLFPTMEARQGRCGTVLRKGSDSGNLQVSLGDSDRYLYWWPPEWLEVVTPNAVQQATDECHVESKVRPQFNVGDRVMINKEPWVYDEQSQLTLLDGMRKLLGRVGTVRSDEQENYVLVDIEGVSRAYCWPVSKLSLVSRPSVEPLETTAPPEPYVPSSNADDKFFVGQKVMTLSADTIRAVRGVQQQVGKGTETLVDSMVPLCSQVGTIASIHDSTVRGLQTTPGKSVCIEFEGPQSDDIGWYWSTDWIMPVNSAPARIKFDYQFLTDHRTVQMARKYGRDHEWYRLWQEAIETYDFASGTIPRDLYRRAINCPSICNAWTRDIIESVTEKAE